MMTWLHDLDTLRSLSDESGPIAHWARLQRLARGDRGPPPLDEATVGAGLALAPDQAHTVLREHTPEVGWVVHHALRQLGIAPDAPDLWTEVLVPHLSSPAGAAAASTLTVLGVLDRSHLVTVLKHDRDDTVLPAWVLATTPDTALEETATGIAEDLRHDLAQSCSVLLQTISLLTPGHPEGAPTDPVAAAEHGAKLAGATLQISVAPGSARTQGFALLAALSGHIDGPLGALLAALGALKRAPAVHPAIVAAASWAAHYQPSGDPLVDVMQRSSRRPKDVHAAREAIKSAPEHVDNNLDAALCMPFLDDPDVARRVLAAEALEVGVFWVREAAAARHPDQIVAMLTDPERRAEALTLAAYCPTEVMLDTLLGLGVPAVTEARAYFAEALLRMGVPVVIPTVRALLPHLDTSDVSEMRALAVALFNQEL